MMKHSLYSDAAWWSKEENGGGPVKRYKGFKRSARYIAMKDGTKIATYLYLPEGVAEDDKIPCILFMTPYPELCRKVSKKGLENPITI